MAVSYPTKVSLAFRSGGVCAFPDCGKHLVYKSEKGSDKHVAEAAHIFGEKQGAARWIPDMTQEQRDSIENLLYMCPTCHDIIDKAEIDWPAKRLFELKTSHEERVIGWREAAFADVAFEELRTSVAWVSDQDIEVSGVTFDLISPREKLAKNGLSNGSKHIIVGALAAQHIVAEFVESEAKLDPDFPDKLKAGFLKEYYTLVHQGHKGDTLFELMCDFAQQGMEKQKDRSAGLAVLVYLFEKCDVFEK